MRQMVAALAMGMMIATPVPASARDRDGRHGDRHRDRREDGKAGGFVAGALVAGLIAAVVASARKPASTVVADAEPIPLRTQTDAEAATAACAAAIEEQGRHSFALAQVGQVRAVAPLGVGYAVDGDVLLRAGWRDAGVRHGFRCTVDADSVRTADIDGIAISLSR